MATNPRVAAYEADKRAQNLYNSIIKPKPAMAAKGPAPVGAKKPTPVNQSITAMLAKLPAGFSRPTAKPPVRKPEKNIMTHKKGK